MKFPAISQSCKLTKEGGDVDILYLTPKTIPTSGTPLPAQKFDALSNTVSSNPFSVYDASGHKTDKNVGWLSCAENYCTQTAADAAFTNFKNKAVAAYKTSVGKSAAATTFDTADRKWKDVFGESTLKNFTFTTVMRLTDGVKLSDCHRYEPSTSGPPADKGDLVGPGAYIVQYERDATADKFVCKAYALTWGTTTSKDYLYAKVLTPPANPVLATGPSLWSLNQIFVANEQSGGYSGYTCEYGKDASGNPVGDSTSLTCDNFVKEIDSTLTAASSPTSQTPTVKILKTNWEYRIWRNKINCIACGWNWGFGATDRKSVV
jgi:hypothetical protein